MKSALGSETIFDAEDSELYLYGILAKFGHVKNLTIVAHKFEDIS